ncbi:hypothetical protein GCM10018773_00630 [Streptomyces candidus]|nr:hypothetical protein GCM10018773_00630 [Streptomyces candidus]
MSAGSAGRTELSRERDSRERGGNPARRSGPAGTSAELQRLRNPCAAGPATPVLQAP